MSYKRVVILWTYMPPCILHKEQGGHVRSRGKEGHEREILVEQGKGARSSKHFSGWDFLVF